MTKFEVGPTILVFAFRYALGRMTYAPSLVVEALIENEDQIPVHTRKLIVQEIKDHESSFGNLGMDCDKETWYGLIERWKDGD